MSTLIKRATPSQARIYRIVRGAVRNAADAHPEHSARQLAASVAKRAAGTLSSQWPEVLAAKSAATDMPSDGTGDVICGRRRPPGADICDRQPARRASQVLRRSPLRLLRREIGIMAGDARKAGAVDREAALVDVLRLLAMVAA